MKHGVHLVALLLAASPSIFAQQGSGTIQGTVLDPQGAVVPSARVEVRNLDTNATFETLTNETGLYTAPGLSVGPYEVAAQSQGFKRALRSGVVLQVNQNALVDLTLEVGQLAEVVEVRADAALVDAGGATVGAVIERKRVTDLPLNGRSALALTLLTSGVISNAGPTASGFGDRGTQLSALSINGGPNSMNAQMLDGNNNTLSYAGEIGVPPAVDSVEEFKVQSGAMSAEFGFTAGGAVNLVTRSGSNKLHGSAYEFLRNDALDARNTFDPGKLPLRYNQYGVSAGGPLIKNKTFAFFNWEEYRLRRSTPRISSVPIEPFRRGDFGELRTANGTPIPIYDPATTRPNPAGSGVIRDPFENNVVPQSRFDPVSPQMVDLWPSPNRTPSNPYTFSQNYQDAAVTNTDWTQWNGRLDHSFTQKNTIFFRYTQVSHFTGTSAIFPDPTVGSNRLDDQTNKNVVLSDTHVFTPTLLNNLRVGLSRQAFDFTPANYGQGWPDQLGLPVSIPRDQMPQVNFGYGIMGGGQAGIRGSLNWDVQNMTTWVVRSHTLKIGANYRHLYGGNNQGPARAGVYSFSGLTRNPRSPSGTGADMAQFLLGDVTSATLDRTLGNSWSGETLSFFLQDDWKLSRRLTLNLGLRYDYQSKPVERYDGHINFDPGCTLPNGVQGCTVYAGYEGQPRSFRDADYNDFGPRFGFAYDLTGQGKTVLRGGYGIYYPSIFWRSFFGDTNLFTQTRTTYTAPTNQSAFRFSDGLPFEPLGAIGRSAGPDGLLGQAVSLTEPVGTTPMSQQWNVGVQHQLGDWLLDVAYVGNKGNHFVSGNYDLNQLDPQLMQQMGLSLFDPVPNPLAGLVPGALGTAQIIRAQTLVAYPGYQSVAVNDPLLGNYASHQVQVNVQKRFSEGSLLSVAFTGGKKISDSLDSPVNFGSVEQVTAISYQNGLYDRRAEKSVDPTDISRRLVLSGLYQLPFGAGKRFDADNGLNRLIGGWQLNAIGVMQNGVPVVVSQNPATNFAATRPDSTGVSAALPSDQRTPEHWFDTAQFMGPALFAFGNTGRALPDVRNPGVTNWDLSLIKDTPLAETVNLQFRVEAFNAFNHVNYGMVNSLFVPGADGSNSSSNFGTITSARDARVLQLGLKLLF
ncbi:MAG: hypothetical protein GC160_07735 [Acidobacteria bacterium]|nr:hypothetical protein [Acidobacteriota bacterium]